MFQIKVEPSSGDSVKPCLPQNINFHPHNSEAWHSTFSASRQEMEPLTLNVSADKGFNYSNIDEAFIAQKKNHFQLTCQVDMKSNGHKKHHFVKTEAGGSLKEISYFQLNFFGIKYDVPNSYIRVSFAFYLQ